MPCRICVALAAMALAASAASSDLAPLGLRVGSTQARSYDRAVPTPESLFGFRFGDWHHRPEQVETYFRTVASISPRVRFFPIGRSYQGRNLFVVVVTSPDNQTRLDAIRAANRRLSSEPDRVADSDLERMPTVLWLGYGVHGNEASATEAAMAVLYHLAAGRGPTIDRILRETVVVIEPNMNPDGRSRHVEWISMHRSRHPNPDPRDREKAEPWPGSRTNHFWFDLNRDWLPAVQLETQARLVAFYDWRPQMLVDVHEMGSASTYYFHPGIPTSNNPRTPPEIHDLTEAASKFFARSLDRRNQGYFTREVFDDFYIGKGSTFPDLQGAVGILFEQASTRGRAARVGGEVVPYVETVANQTATSLGALEAAVELRPRLLRMQRQFFGSIPEWAGAHRAAGYAIRIDRWSDRASELLALMARHQIEVFELAEPVAVDGQVFEPGRAVFAPLNQTQGRFLESAFERMTEFESRRFYDVSAWSLPDAFGVEWAEVPNGTVRLGGRYEPRQPAEPRVSRGRIGYLVRWEGVHSARALVELLRAGANVRSARLPGGIAVGDQTVEFGPGALFVRNAEDAAETHRLVQRVARETGVPVFPVDTGLTPVGPDLGSANWVPLRLPRIALLVGRGVSSNRAGEAWFTISERLGLPLTLLEAADTVSLADFDVVVMPGGSYSEGLMERVRGFLASGTLLIATGTGADAVARQSWLNLRARQLRTTSRSGMSYADVAEVRGEDDISGAIVEVRLDRTHPLAAALPERLPVFRSGRTFFDPPAAGGVNLAVYAERPLLAGYLPDGSEDGIAGASAMVATRVGGGRVVLLFDDPSFRGFWRGSEQAFVNALLLGPVY
ncbi:MAG: M14 family zinc carboxypeptidase [Fimbriimonadaceae bacterium]